MYDKYGWLLPSTRSLLLVSYPPELQVRAISCIDTQMGHSNKLKPKILVCPKSLARKDWRASLLLGLQERPFLRSKYILKQCVREYNQYWGEQGNICQVKSKLSFTSLSHQTYQVHLPGKVDALILWDSPVTDFTLWKKMVVISTPWFYT